MRAPRRAPWPRRRPRQRVVVATLMPSPSFPAALARPASRSTSALSRRSALVPPGGAAKSAATAENHENRGVFIATMKWSGAERFGGHAWPAAA
jgi:hypothetical protein